MIGTVKRRSNLSDISDQRKPVLNLCDARDMNYLPLLGYALGIQYSTAHPIRSGTSIIYGA